MRKKRSSKHIHSSSFFQLRRKRSCATCRALIVLIGQTDGNEKKILIWLQLIQSLRVFSFSTFCFASSSLNWIDEVEKMIDVFFIKERCCLNCFSRIIFANEQHVLFLRVNFDIVELIRGKCHGQDKFNLVIDQPAFAYLSQPLKFVNLNKEPFLRFSIWDSSGMNERRY